MTVIRVKGFKIFRDKKPPYKLRCYHRGTGQKINLDAAPIGSVAFLAECQKINALAESSKARDRKPGTLGELIGTYFATEHFRETLSDRTRKDYRKVADYLAPIVDTPVHRIDTPLIAAIHDKAASKLGWRQANMLRTLLFEVFRYCIPKGLIAGNPAIAVIPKPRPKTRPRANRPWTVAELIHVVDTAPPHIAAVIALIAATGLDPSDALRLRRDQIESGVVWAARGKTGRNVPLPITGRLKAALDAVPPHGAETILATTKGTPWTYDGFASGWHRWKKKMANAGTILPDLTPKGLRHTVGTVLREGGMSLRQIADFLGQSEEAMAHWYSRDADLTERNRITAELLNTEIARRRELSNSVAKPSNPMKGSSDDRSYNTDNKR